MTDIILDEEHYFKQFCEFIDANPDCSASIAVLAEKAKSKGNGSESDDDEAGFDEGRPQDEDGSDEGAGNRGEDDDSGEEIEA